MSKIKDSGARVEFSTGAVRDIKDDKGRCDLLPLAIVGAHLCRWNATAKKFLVAIEFFKQTGDSQYIYQALDVVCKRFFRENDVEMYLEVSIHFKQGAEKYGFNNWQKGIPVHSYIDSAVRHFLKALDGQEDERHDRACAWNLLCLLWTLENRPEMNDLSELGFLNSK